MERLPLVKDAQRKWADAVTNNDLETLLSLYHPKAVLKPTLSSIVRRTPEDIRQYFVGGEKFNDRGFLKSNFKKVEFIETEPKLYGSIVFDMGVYRFTNPDDTHVLAQFTFVYELDEDGKIVILAQHSSLPVE